ncbi:MAG: acyl--CoA ligase [Clostridia bacterium]|nr:acyl--CoA ligase [Clostridia bacterium]
MTESFNVPSMRALLDQGAEKHGDTTFIKYLRHDVIEEKSYRQLRSDSLAVCRLLRDRCAPRTKVAVIGKTSYEFLVCMTGVLLSGNVAVPFAPEISAKEASMLFARVHVGLLFYETEFAARAQELQKADPALKIVCLDEIAQYYDAYGPDSPFAALSEQPVDPEETAIIIFTSGTTGIRKGVMLSSDALIGNIMYRDYCTEVFRENDVSLSILPMYHCYCFSGDYIKNLKDGVQVCLNGNLRDLTKNLPLFAPRILRCVPLIAESLLRRVKALHAMLSVPLSEIKQQVFGPNLEWMISGGAYLNPQLISEYEDLGIHLRQGYGMTEAGCRISVPDMTADPASVGRVIDLCTVRVRGGEIQVSTPTMMSGYYDMPEETAAVFTSDGWLRTGDIGYVTPDRQLFITGRLKNLIILSGGENVSPEAIEKKFAAEPLIKEVMVYAENDRIIAEFYPDEEYAARSGVGDIREALELLVDTCNETAKSAHIISDLRVRNTPFPKTGSGKLFRKRTEIG